jgi:hypothetical protein
MTPVERPCSYRLGDFVERWAFLTWWYGSILLIEKRSQRRRSKKSWACDRTPKHRERERQRERQRERDRERDRERERERETDIKKEGRIRNKEEREKKTWNEE